MGISQPAQDPIQTRDQDLSIPWLRQDQDFEDLTQSQAQDLSISWPRLEDPRQITNQDQSITSQEVETKILKMGSWDQDLSRILQHAWIRTCPSKWMAIAKLITHVTYISNRCDLRFLNVIAVIKIKLHNNNATHAPME